MFVPVRILDDHLHTRIAGAGRVQHQGLRDLAHLLEPILRPAAAAFCGDVGIAFGGVEEEVVKDDLIEGAGSQLDGSLALCAVLRILVIEGAELTGVATRRERDASGDDHTPGGKESLDPAERCLIRKLSISIDLEIDFVEAELACDACVLVCQCVCVCELTRRIHRDIDRCREVPIGTVGPCR